MKHFAKLGVLAVGATIATAGLSVAPAAPAHATSSVVVSPAPSFDGPTTVTLTGSGFQYVPNAPDGIYIMFGVVSDPTSMSWAPSQGGQGGVTYSYSSVDGSIALIGFEGGGAAEGQSSPIDPEGNWSTDLVIPGSSFVLSSGKPSGDAEAKGEVVDCLVETCGIITIGAMGKINANNETFTPVTFAEPEPEPAPETTEPDSGDETEAEATADTDESPGDVSDEAAADAEADPGSSAPWIIGGAAAVIVIAGAAAIGLARRKRSA